MQPNQLRALGLWEGQFFRWTRKLSRQCFHALLVYRCGLNIRGADKIDGLSQFILAPNHASHLDFWAVLEGLSPQQREKVYIAAAADYFYSTWIRRWFIQMISFHNFPFARQPLSLEAYQQLKKILSQGLSLLIFAQGSRSRNGQIQPFKPLVSMLSVETQIPVVPVVVKGTFEALPAGQWWPRHHPITVIFGQPLRPPAEDTLTPGYTLHAAIREFNQTIMAQIQSLWQQAEK